MIDHYSLKVGWRNQHDPEKRSPGRGWGKSEVYDEGEEAFQMLFVVK